MGWNIFKKDRGVSLMETLIVLVMMSFLIAAAYRTFIGQQKVYTLQEQVADAQQSVRVAMDRMTREIRMAGFGAFSNVLTGEGVNGFTSVITPGPDRITIVGAFKPIRRSNGEPIVVSSVSENQVTLRNATNEFDRTDHQYISIGGTESNTVASRSGAKLTLHTALTQTHSPGSPVYKIQAITYSLGTSSGKQVLQRNENTGGGAQPMTEDIEMLRFQYFDGSGNITDTPALIRMVRVNVISRTTMADPQLSGDGYRRRTLTSNIKVRNLGL